MFLNICMCTEFNIITMNKFFRFLSLDAFSASIAFKLKIILKVGLGTE